MSNIQQEINELETKKVELKGIGKKLPNKDANRLRELKNTVTGFIYVELSEMTVLLPTTTYKSPVSKKDGGFNQNNWNFFSNNIVKILDTKPIQNLSVFDKVNLFNFILQTEHYEPVSDIMEADSKLRGANWGVLNADTGITCPNRANGRCDFCGYCYASGSCRYPSTAKKQMAKMIFFHSNDVASISASIDSNGHPVIRFDQEGEFNSLDDFLKLVDLANANPKVRFYSYTKNYEVLRWIFKNSDLMPKNLNIKDSLGITPNNHYLAVEPELIPFYLSMGYVLCKGACVGCQQCLIDGLNIVTPLRK